MTTGLVLKRFWDLAPNLGGLLLFLRPLFLAIINPPFHHGRSARLANRKSKSLFLPRAGNTQAHYHAFRGGQKTTAGKRFECQNKKKQLYVRMNFPLLTGVCSSVHALLLHAHKCEACQIKMELLNGQWRIATRDGLASIDAIPPP